MPLYEYYCDNCRRAVAVTLSIGEDDQRRACLPPVQRQRSSPVVECILFSDVPEVLITRNELRCPGHSRQRAGKS
jgi:hypothetical protein